MNQIDQAIPYTWTLGWNMPKHKPVVNLLIKAILDQNCTAIDDLLARGASLKCCDLLTLRHALFHVAGNYSVMARLVANGLSRVGTDVDFHGDNGINDPTCVSPVGGRWGLIGRAYYLEAYDVMNLLAANGFDDYKCYEPGWDESWYADFHILRTEDRRGIQILMENGYVLDRRYEHLVLERSQIRRKSVGLDPWKFRTDMPRPWYEDEPLLFGRASAQARNARRREDYEDRIRALKEFRETFGSEKVQTIHREKTDFNKLFVKAANDVLSKRNSG